jgi:hypothetical protein
MTNSDTMITLGVAGVLSLGGLGLGYFILSQKTTEPPTETQSSHFHPPNAKWDNKYQSTNSKMPTNWNEKYNKGNINDIDDIKIGGKSLRKTRSKRKKRRYNTRK